MELRSDFSIQQRGTFIGGSLFDTDTIVAFKGIVAVDQLGTYSFASSGGDVSRIIVNSVAYTAPVELAVGCHEVEYRVAAEGLGSLPAELLMGVGTPESIATELISHSQADLVPFISTAPASTPSIGGETITLEGLGYFPADSVEVLWNGVALSEARVNVLGASRIEVLVPPGTNSADIKIQTPLGVSNIKTILYDDTGVPILFDRLSPISAVAPTVAEWGPDGRLYVGSFTGNITAIEFDQNYRVVSSQTIPALASAINPHILGITFDPRETASDFKIYVAHSVVYAGHSQIENPDPYICEFSQVQDFLGQVSTISSSDFTSATPLITNLPVSNHDHGINGCLLYTSPSPRDATLSRMPSSA